ncbi:MAG: glycosyltransferase, partial [Sulfurifustis sp.]
LPRLWCRVDNSLSGEIDLLRAKNPKKALRRLIRYQRLYSQRALIAVSDGVAEDLRSGLGLRQVQIERIYNPFNITAIRARAREAVPLPDRPYVLHVGRFVRQKRHDVLLDAWSAVQTTHCLVLLTKYEPTLAQMIEQRGLGHRVVIAGFQSNPYAWMLHADLLVLSSDHEGLSNVIIESLIVGTPVVSTDCPSGPREILGDAFPDCLTPVGNAAALADAIRRGLMKPPDTTRANLARFGLVEAVTAHERLARI